MQVPIKVQSQDEPSSRSLKYKDTDDTLLKGLLTILVVGIAILVSILYGKTLVSHLAPGSSYSSNQVEVIQQEYQIITASLAEQRSSIHSMELRLIDQNHRNEGRFTELEDKIASLEEQIQQITMVAEQYSSHRVMRGDTLWRISMQYYGTGQYIHDLAQYNSIANPRIIVTGTVIKIPPISAFR